MIGIEFWKVGSRKIYAVLDKLIIRSKAADTSTSSSSSESDIPKQPRTKKTSYDNIGKDIKSIKSSLSSLFAVQKTLKIPIALRQVLLDNFRCTICQDTITPPAIFSRCCRYLIGCEKCIDKWYTDRNKSCPRCRQERSFPDTCRLNGLDDFLTIVRDLLSDGKFGEWVPPIIFLLFHNFFLSILCVLGIS